VDRKLHFVGTLPQFADPAGAFRWQQRELADDIRQWCGGETGPRLLWFVPVVKELARSPKIRVITEGDWTGYEDTDRLALRWGRRLTAGDLPLRLAEFARAEHAVLAELGWPATAARPMQVGVPGYLDMAMFTFGPLGALRHAGAFRRALAQEVAAVHAEAGPGVVFQLEVPAELVAVAAAPGPLRPVFAAVMAWLITRQVAAAPPGSRFGVHLCLGDLGHRAVRQLPDAGPLVALATALLRRWPAGRQLDYLHLPLSGGDEPPSADPTFYAPLSRLRRPAGVRIVAGLAHEEQDLDTQRRVRDVLERALGGPVDIATSCGLGRRTPDQAEQAVARMRALAAN
jgi:hypothetical protein